MGFLSCCRRSVRQQWINLKRIPDWWPLILKGLGQSCKRPSRLAFRFLVFQLRKVCRNGGCLDKPLHSSSVGGYYSSVNSDHQAYFSIVVSSDFPQFFCYAEYFRHMSEMRTAVAGRSAPVNRWIVASRVHTDHMPTNQGTFRRHPPWVARPFDTVWWAGVFLPPIAVRISDTYHIFYA